MKRIAFILILLINISAYAQKVTKTYHKNGNVNEVRRFDQNGKATGEWVSYFDNGGTYQLKNYKNGMLDGEYK